MNHQGACAVPVAIDPITIENLNLKAVVVETHTTDEELGALFNELQSEECHHTWSFFERANDNDLLRRLKEFENKKRETHFFFYYGVFLDGRRELIGAGTIAAKVKHTFPSHCFPVISRCFIKRKYRGNRFYLPILKHRFDVCHHLWGKDLFGIHLGTANPSIMKTIQNAGLGLDFIFVGVENLDPKRSDIQVHDYLYLAPSFREKLLQIPENLHPAKSITALSTLMNFFTTNQADPSAFMKLKNVIRKVQEETGWSPLQNESIREFVRFLESIPVLEMDWSPNENF